MIEREAKLLEAGSYPDRGVEITEEDLDLMTANTADAPLRIEHTDTPFDGALGVLKSVYRKGRELFGKLLFTSAAWELIKAANAKRLSVAIMKDKSSIAEVSLVRSPRVPDAAVFSAEDTLRFEGCELLQDRGIPHDSTVPAGAASDSRLSTPDDRQPEDLGEVEALRHELAAREVDSAIDRFKLAGKLAPAAEPFARAILLAGDSSLIRFGKDSMPVGVIFRRFLESQPRVIEFAELAAAGETETSEPEVFARLGVTSAQVEKHKSR